MSTDPSPNTRSSAREQLKSSVVSLHPDEAAQKDPGQNRTNAHGPAANPVNR